VIAFLAFVAKAIHFVAEFVEDHDGSASSARFCAILLCLMGCACAAFTVRFAFLHPDQAAMVAALVGVTTALIGSGCVAIFLRTPVP
jgi:hypothetical protein